METPANTAYKYEDITYVFTVVEGGKKKGLVSSKLHKHITAHACLCPRSSNILNMSITSVKEIKMKVESIHRNMNNLHNISHCRLDEV